MDYQCSAITGERMALGQKGLSEKRAVKGMAKKFRSRLFRIFGWSPTPPRVIDKEVLFENYIVMLDANTPLSISRKEYVDHFFAITMADLFGLTGTMTHNKFKKELLDKLYEFADDHRDDSRLTQDITDIIRCVRQQVPASNSVVSMAGFEKLESSLYGSIRRYQETHHGN